MDVVAFSCVIYFGAHGRVFCLACDSLLFSASLILCLGRGGDVLYGAMNGN